MIKTSTLVRDIAQLFLKYRLDDWRPILDALQKGHPQSSDLLREIYAEIERAKTRSIKKNRPKINKETAPSKITSFRETPERAALLLELKRELSAPKSRKLDFARDLYLKSGTKTPLPQGRKEAVPAVLKYLAELPEESYSIAAKAILSQESDLERDYEKWFAIIYGENKKS